MESEKSNDTIATKDSWTTLPMPEKNVVIPMDMILSKEDMQIIRRGSIPTSMGMKWFMYCDEDAIRYFRSFTGFCIYEAKYVVEGDNVRITELKVNREPTQYGCLDDREDKAWFSGMIHQKIDFSKEEQKGNQHSIRTKRKNKKMRSKIVAGNWKMNLTFDEAEDLVDNILDLLDEQEELNCEVIICPPYPYLELLTDCEADEQCFNVGAQNCSTFDKGAYTGEVSAKMLKSLEVDYCIVGHSERRKYFGETNEMLAMKINRLIENNISPIYCVGEVLEEREAGRHFDVVREQIEKGLFHLDGDAIYDVVIAYEPVWAIGTGKTATPEQAQEMHAFIRSLIKEHYDEATADEIRILYGGSCNAKNATELFSQPDVDGGLIGGASLKAEDFVSICNQASHIGEE